MSWVPHKAIVLPLPSYLPNYRNDKRNISIDIGIEETIKHLWKHKIVTLGSCIETESTGPSLIIGEDYDKKGIKRILTIIKEVDRREWKIYKWCLLMVATKNKLTPDIPDNDFLTKQE